MIAARLAAVLLVVPTALVGCSPSASTASCGGDEQVIRSPLPIFGPVASSADPRLERLSAAMSRWGLGRVAGGVGYDYGQWLSLGGSPEGLIAWTRRDPVIAFLDADLRPRWGLEQAQVPHAWTSDASSFFQLELSPRHPMRLTAYRLSDGHREWCVVVGDRPTGPRDVYGTGFVPGGDLLVLARGKDGPRLTRLDVRSGRPVWSRPLTGIDRGAYVGDLGNGLALVGGRASYQIGDPQTPQPPGSALVAVDERTGSVRWRYHGDQVHVIGRGGGLVLLRQGSGLVGLETDGRVRWRRSAAALGSDFATAGTMMVANTGRAFVGIDPRTGRERWRTPYPKSPQYLPYGFVLAAQPMLDARQLLIGGTTGLHSLDVRTGRVHTYALPIDGINTTYWPYQVVLTSRLLAVVTNTGGVVLDRLG